MFHDCYFSATIAAYIEVCGISRPIPHPKLVFVVFPPSLNHFSSAAAHIILLKEATAIRGCHFHGTVCTVHNSALLEGTCQRSTAGPEVSEQNVHIVSR